MHGHKRATEGYMRCRRKDLMFLLIKRPGDGVLPEGTLSDEKGEGL